MRASVECQHGPGPGTFVLSASVFLYSDRGNNSFTSQSGPGVGRRELRKACKYKIALAV